MLSKCCLLIALITATAAVAAEPPGSVPDPRHISNGWKIPSEGYADQPYVVQTNDGPWLCAITTGKGVEGAAGQHIVSIRSGDRGKTWSQPVDIEPANGPEASYVVLLKTPPGRVYAFYNHNTDNIREVKRVDRGTYQRVDSLGHYVFKYSDDHGKSWSPQRQDVPVREFACDRKNTYGGKIRFFWNVGRPLVTQEAALLTLHKVGNFGEGFFTQSEGCFLRSANILTERDPRKIQFVTLPDGDVGLRTPEGGGPISEEQSVVELSDRSLYCVYRTVDGWPASAYSRDGGHTWSKPEYASYEPGGRRIKHPRAANFVWKCSNGKYLYWFHNHGGSAIADYQAKRLPGSPYDDRNPAWIAAGVERDSSQGKVIAWSQPEILLYDDDPFIRMSYPDLIEQDGKFYVTETQKNVARTHAVPDRLLKSIFAQFDNCTLARECIVLELADPQAIPATTKMPVLPSFHLRNNRRADYGDRDMRAGFTLDIGFLLESLKPEQILLDSRDGRGKGLALVTTAAGTLQIILNDGRSEARWDSDPGAITAGKSQRLAIIVDGGPKIISMIANGQFCDGGERRQFGWGRFSPTLRTPNPDGPADLRIGPALDGKILSLRIYGRALLTSEAVGNFRSGR